MIRRCRISLKLIIEPAGPDGSIRAMVAGGFAAWSKYKEPGTSAELFYVQCCPRLEFVAQATTDCIDRLPDIVETGERRRTEVVMQVFGPQEHVIHQLVFKPCACHPTELADAVREADRTGEGTVRIG